MNRLTDLAERLDDLKLAPLQERIARLLLQGHEVVQIASILEQPEPRIRLSVARIFSLVRRPRPPDAAIDSRLPARPPHAPRNAGTALNLPEHPSIKSPSYPFTAIVRKTRFELTVRYPKDESCKRLA
jgi:hypothetical protein